MHDGFPVAKVPELVHDTAQQKIKIIRQNHQRDDGTSDETSADLEGSQDAGDALEKEIVFGVGSIGQSQERSDQLARAAVYILR